MIESEKNIADPKQAVALGVDLHYEDAFGKLHHASDETLQAVLAAMGAHDRQDAPADDPLVVVHMGESRELPKPATVVLESGKTILVKKRLPTNLPAGYHRLQFDREHQAKPLIVSPGKCFLPKNLKTWGWAVQLYAARSQASWGIGDFSDLERLAKWSASELRAGMMLVNPLSGATPITPQQTSPYYPTSRRFFNPLWIHVEWVPGAASGHVPDLEAIAQQGRTLSQQRLIDRDKVFELKMRALALLWERFEGNVEFDAFSKEHRLDLHHFATFCTLAEHFQSGWHAWPKEYHHPAAEAVARFARENSNRVQFHKWLQWLLDGQMARCSKHLALMQDLPIGVDPDGADAWAWQDVFTSQAGVGAPPDEFNTQGQNWGLPPFVPHKLRAAGYEPFIQTIRAAFRNGGGLRIDHVMGLFRLYWIPEGMSAAHGTYVRYNADELLSIVALESERAKAYVVGEDLGTVEKEARRKLAHYQVMSYRLLWFEKDDPATYPHEALAAITTHDLPTVAGLWTGSDLKKQHELKLNPNEESTAEIHERLTKVARLKPDSAIEDVIARSYGLLAKSPCRILTAALEDAAAVEERPNVPATTSDKNPNWSVALPMVIDELMTAPLPRQIAKELQRSE
ncbi:MAG: 4-alpha-glucanotransferase [Acidobacteriota bacterium]|nr:4-alpha-glucanotransferase [Acidobacteriota bacterium]